MHCVISGAADGIGRALALRFAAAGYRITGIDRDAESAAATRREIEARGGQAGFILADLSQPIDLQRCIKTLSQGPDIQVLIHNAGINHFHRFADSDPDRQRQVIEVNLHVPIHLTAALFQHDKLPAHGSLVFVASLSNYVSYPGASVYAASKAGLAAYARSLSVALAGRDIQVLTVYPGPTRTEHARRYSPDNSREHKRMPPETLAEQIFQAVIKRRRLLIPGSSNKLFAWLGKYFPRLTEAAMKRSLFDKLPPG